MNGKLIVRTGLITAAVIAALAFFCYNASYNPDFSALDFITSASPKKKAKNRKDVRETVYGIRDFGLDEPLDGFDEIPVVIILIREITNGWQCWGLMRQFQLEKLLFVQKQLSFQSAILPIQNSVMKSQLSPV